MDPEEFLKWLKSMDTEMSNLIEHWAFELVPHVGIIQANKKIVKSVWAFCQKQKPDGSASRHKSLLVAHGNLQKEVL